MSITKCGFIAKGPGFSPQQHASLLKSDQFAVQVVCVENVEQAKTVAQRMVAEGVQLIELCGGFGAELASQVSAAIDGKVPVGFVTFTDVEKEKLERAKASS